MLFQFGDITIDSPAGFNATGSTLEFGSDYAVKPVVGAAQPREFVGEADRRRQITGKLYPFRARAAGQDGGGEEILALSDLASSGEPQILVRGDGTDLDFWLLEKFSMSSSNLAQGGTGREIEYTLSIVKSPADASADSTLGVIESLLS